MKIILAALVFAAAITGQAYDADMMEDQLEASGAHAIEDALPDDARDIMDELGLELTYDGANGANADSAIETIADLAIQSSKRPLRVCISALGIVVLCALARTITDKDENSLTASFDTISSCAAVLTVCVPAGEIIDLAAEGIGNSCSFGAILVPVLAGLTAVSGRAAGVGVQRIYSFGYRNRECSYINRNCSRSANSVRPFGGGHAVIYLRYEQTDILGGKILQMAAGVCRRTAVRCTEHECCGGLCGGQYCHSGGTFRHRRYRAGGGWCHQRSHRNGAELHRHSQKLRGCFRTGRCYDHCASICDNRGGVGCVS